jgi:flagellar FliJ protein
MPKSDSTMHKLIDLTKEKADEAARQLQTANASRQSAGDQLDTLNTYRQDYADRLQKAISTGLSAANYHNFRQFIATLDDAISQQNKIVAQLDAKVELSKKNWVDQKRQLTSFETLLARQRMQESLRESKLEQRTTDEQSMNLYRRNQRGH